MLTVCIQGLGFVGAAMATAIAGTMKNGANLFNVIGVDQNTASGQKRIESINKGIFPFKTNDQKLVKTLKKGVSSGNLRATHEVGSYGKADIVEVVSINCDLLKRNDLQN